MKKTGQYVVIAVVILLLSAITASDMHAQGMERDPNKHYRVIDGTLREVAKDTTAHALGDLISGVDSTAIISGNEIMKDIDVPSAQKVDSVKLTRAEARELKRLEQNDTTLVRYSKIFRDTMPLSRMTAISVVVPGFSQFYNKQPLKIPILYATVGTFAYLGIQQNKKFQAVNRIYNDLLLVNANRTQLDPIHRQVIDYNTRRTILFAGAVAGYLYFLGDGVMNYKGTATNVKKATTLSTICPGAGQVYNKSYWKLPIVVGAFATMGYVIDYNTRGYNRIKLAYTQLTDGDPNTVDEFEGRYSESSLRSIKNNYRRNRDLSIIITGGLYILNIIDAHVDAHMKDFDVSDDLSSISLEPVILNICSINSPSANAFGLSFKYRF